MIEGGEVSNERDALALSENIGFPVILKAVEGGGGRGLRIVKAIDELKQAFLSSKNESLLSFGSNRIYIEKYIENPRHIEYKYYQISQIFYILEKENVLFNDVIKN